MYFNMELKDTIELMNSSNYKDRFRAEYQQLKIRIDKLQQIIIKHDSGELDFKPDTPIETLKYQYKVMGEYLHILETRATFEDINLK